MIKKKKVTSVNEEEKLNPMVQQFREAHSGRVEGIHVKGTIALKLPQRMGDFDKVLQQVENRWIFDFGTRFPAGINH